METHLRDCDVQNCSCEERRYKVIMKYCAVIVAVQLVGYVLSVSFSLLSDTIHVGIDFWAAGVAFMVARYVRLHRQFEKQLRFGGAVLHIILLYVAAWQIIEEGLEKLIQPNQVVSGYLLVAAAIGGYLNIRQKTILHKITDKTTDTFWWMNWHIISDLLGNVAVVSAGLVIWFSGYLLADPIASFVVAALMLSALPIFIIHKIQARHQAS